MSRNKERCRGHVDEQPCPDTVAFGIHGDRYCWRHLSARRKTLQLNALIAAYNQSRESTSLNQIAAKEYPRSGSPWSDQEHLQLLRSWMDGTSLSQIARELERSPGAICSRLELLQAPSYHEAIDATRYPSTPAPDTPLPPPGHDAATGPGQGNHSWPKPAPGGEAVVVVPRQRRPPFSQLGPQPVALVVPMFGAHPDWNDLALFVDCWECFAEVGEQCHGPTAGRVRPGVWRCDSRQDQVPLSSAPPCPVEWCAGSCVDRPDGWTETCWSHLSKVEQADVKAERRTLRWGDESNPHLLVDIAAALALGCSTCRSRPGTPCLGAAAKQRDYPHRDRLLEARDLRRSANGLRDKALHR